MIRFSNWLVSCYSHIFVLLWIVIVTLPLKKDLAVSGRQFLIGTLLLGRSYLIVH